MNRLSQQYIREQTGTTLISLLIASTVTMLVAGAMSVLVFTNTAQYTKTFTRSNSLVAAETAFDRLGRLVRMARSLGDVQGDTMVSTDPYSGFPPGPSGDAFAVQDNNVNLAQVEAGTACNTSARFPSSADYYYNSSTGTLYNAVSSWPWASSMVSGQYLLSPTTLIVQVQCFDKSGMPEVVTGETNLPALDTYIFNIVPDNSRPGPTQWYQLQMACFPAEAALTNVPTKIKPGIPITVCSGIVGPLDPVSGTPQIFQYINSKDNSTQTNFDSSTGTGAANEQDLLLFRGVIINMQIMNIDAAGKPALASMRTELYLRNNSSATILGPG